MPGLSCYTANLHAYLAAEWDADALLARSIRLAAQAGPADDLLFLSHHFPSLHILPDGTTLGYQAAGSPGEALDQLDRELGAHGRALAMVDGRRLPWSPARSGPPVPHWLLVGARRGQEWHVTDAFTALLPSGQQNSFAGWLSGASLRAALRLPARWSPQQQARNELAFGEPVRVPPGRVLFLRRSSSLRRPAGPEPSRLRGRRWRCGDAEVLPLLIARLTDGSPLASPYLDDLWAAAGHRAFAYRWRLTQGPAGKDREALRGALEQWENLPHRVRLAWESAQRGRPRPTLARAAVDAVLRAEKDIS